MSTVKNCTTCTNFIDVPLNTRDTLLGTYKVCRHDMSHPGARFANPGEPCRLHPVKWAQK